MYIGNYYILIASSLDVIHSWTIQFLGIKVDAIPGRINQLSLFCIRPRLHFGQCLEIFGSNHRFISYYIRKYKFY